MKHLVSFFVLYCLFVAPLFAQLTTDDTWTDEALIQALAGEGVTISNIQFDCPSSGVTCNDGTASGSAYGHFECVDCNIDLCSGLVLTSGCINNAVGPNDLGSVSSTTNGGSDPDLAFAGTTNDACSVSFDVTVQSDKLKFKYVFGSDEYLEYANSNFNDVFAFFIEGPGVPFQNIALLPDGITPVSINNVNDVNNPQYYIDNGDGSEAPYNSSDLYVQYDGFTVVLTAEIDVTAGETYTLKLAVADIADSALDSGVFIQDGSITAFELSGTVEGGFIDPNAANPITIEGCLDATINLALAAPPVDTTTVYLTYGGTATVGVDFIAPLDSFILMPGTTELPSFVIAPLVDNEDEPGFEVIQIFFATDGLCATLDTIELFIRDPLAIEVDPAVLNSCPGATNVLSVVGAVSYQWTPATYLDDPNNPFPFCTPQSSITYQVVGYLGNCTDTANVQVIVDGNFNPQVPPQYSTCANIPVDMLASGGTFYVWAPATGLSCTQCPNPTFTGTATTDFTVSIFDATGCQTDLPVTVVVSSNDLGFADETHILCTGEQHQLNYNPAFTYSISPNTGLSCNNCANAVLSPSQNTVYTVVASSGLCQQTFTIDVAVGSFSVDAGTDQIACQSLETTLGNADVQGLSYQWSPSDGLSADNVAQPNLTLNVTTPLQRSYTVVVTDANGCTATDMVQITLDTPPTLAFTAPDSIIAGNLANISVSGAEAGALYSWSPTEGLSNPNAREIVARPTNTTTYVVTVTEPSAGCVSIDSVTIKVVPQTLILVPTAFSPNGDNINDQLRVIGNAVETLYKFEVFDRWGIKVYSNVSGDLTQGWNGKFNDTDQPTGVYVYYVEYKQFGRDEVKIFKGNTTLIR